MTSDPATPAPTEHPEYAVLVVDDEPGIVNAIRRELNTPPLGRYRYAVEGFSDPAHALERAREKAFAVVISDYRMPGMSGLDFLKALYEIQPDCMRIVLSGQSDMDTLARLVNESRIYRFIAKPWSAHYLKAVLAQTLDYGEVLHENRRLVARPANGCPCATMPMRQSPRCSSSTTTVAC